jgi:hypothetical protein
MIHPKEREIERESEMRGRDRKYSMLFTRKRYIYLSYVICKLVFKLKLLFFSVPIKLHNKDAACKVYNLQILHPYRVRKKNKIKSRHFIYL